MPLLLLLVLTVQDRLLQDGPCEDENTQEVSAVCMHKQETYESFFTGWNRYPSTIYLSRLDGDVLFN